MSDTTWAKRCRLLAEWVRLSEKQVETILAGGEPEELQAVLLAKERLMLKLGRLGDAGDSHAEAADAAEAVRLARHAQELERKAEDALKARLAELRASLKGLGEVRQYVREAPRPRARFLDRYE
ncbi:MAG: hypothetical protein ACUVTZ_06245 [Armatimonadota bacterium]